MMSKSVARILPLPLDVQAKIVSSITITSLNEVVLELLKNSLDAEALKLDIEVDFARGCCSVQDDGEGIPGTEFSIDSGLGKMHYTSKYSRPCDNYGQHGRFLSALSALSLLSITSRRLNEADENTISFYHSKVIARIQTQSRSQYVLSGKAGTRVTVRDLFGTLPVRVKQRADRFENQDDLDKEFEHLKQCIVALVLSWAKPLRVTITDKEKRKRCVLRNSSGDLCNFKVDVSRKTCNKSSFQLSLVRSILAQAEYITSSQFDAWATVSARASRISIRAAISLEPAPTKHLQFISFGMRPIDKSHGYNLLFDEINYLFKLSSFGASAHKFKSSDKEALRYQDGSGFKNEQSPRKFSGHAKGADRWPMFYIRIDMKDDAGSSTAVYQSGEDAEILRYLQKVTELLKSMIYRFLTEHNFQPRALKRNRSGYDQRRRLKTATKTNQDTLSLPLLAKDDDVPTENLSGTSSKSNFSSRLAKPRHPLQSNALDSWSRVKSGNREGLQHMLSGLPIGKSDVAALADKESSAIESLNLRVNTNHPAPDKGDTQLLQDNLNNEKETEPRPEPFLDEDLQLLLGDLNEEERATDAGVDEPNNLAYGAIDAEIDISKGPQQEEKTVINGLVGDETVLWIDPSTDTTVRINSRTGLTIPRLESQLEIPQNNASDSRTLPKITSSRTRLGISKRRKVVPTIKPTRDSWIGRIMKECANSVFPLSEQPIPSILLLDEKVIPQRTAMRCNYGKSGLGITDLDAQFFHNAASAFTGRLSKAALATAHVVAQVDQKFILAEVAAVLPKEAYNNNDNNEARVRVKPLEERVLVLIDQHAADERCRVEELYEQLCDLKVVALPKPIQFDVSMKEHRLFEKQQEYFLSCGVHLTCATPQTRRRPNLRPASTSSWTTTLATSRQVSGPRSVSSSATSVESRNAIATEVKEKAASANDTTIVVTALPELIAERCRLEPGLLIDLLRKEVWDRADGHGAILAPANATNIPTSGDIPSATLADNFNIATSPSATRAPESEQETNTGSSSWLLHISRFPSDMISMLNSRACRSAIMFNDELNLDECRALLARLARCVFPFQCAHGRPSMVALVGLGSFNSGGGSDGLATGGVGTLTFGSFREDHGDGDREENVKGFREAFDHWQRQQHEEQGQQDVEISAA